MGPYLGIRIGGRRGGGAAAEPSISDFWNAVLTAVVENAAPTKVIITSSLINTTLVDTDFTVLGHTVTLLERDATNKILTLTLSTAVIYFDEITVTCQSLDPIWIQNNVADDGDTVAWYDFTDLNTITKVSNLVSEWKDKLLAAGSLLQATGTKQPLYNQTGINFNGDDNCMQSTLAALVQPETVYIVLKQNAWIDGRLIFDGKTGANQLYQSGTTPGIRAYAGTSLSTQDNNLIVGTYGIVRVVFNGANSTVQVDENAPWTGNLGTGSGGGFTLAIDRALTNTGETNIEVNEVILRKAADSGSMQSLIYEILKRKKNITKTGVARFNKNAKLYPTLPLTVDSCNFRSMVKVGTTYHLFEETQYNPNGWSIETRTSSDGITFSAKSARLFQFGAVGTFDRKGQADPSVIYDGVGDWKMWFDALDGSDVWDKLGYATSTDSATWTKYGSILERGASGAWDDNFTHHPSVIKHGGVYYMYYAGAKATSASTYKIGLATSTDGINWTKYASNPIISNGGSGEFDEIYVRPSNPIFIDGLWYMWYWGFNSANHSIGLAVSRDLYTWKKVGKVLGNPAGATGEIDPTASFAIIEGDGNDRVVKIWHNNYLGAVGGITTGSCNVSNAAFMIPTSTILSGFAADGVIANVWNIALGSDPTKVYFNGVEGTEQVSQVACNAEYEWYWAANVLSIYSVEDPNLRYWIGWL
jgi:predicted GH43/DUF377 family glycosyl hydrolase